MIQNDLIALGDYNALNVIQLRALAKKLGIKNFRMRKSDLIIAIDDVTKKTRNEAPVDESVSLTENTTEASENKQDYSTNNELPKTLNNEWKNGVADDSTRQNCALVKACVTPAELTLLLNSAHGATLHRLYEAYKIMPYPYGKDKSKELQIRDFVEYEFRKREGADFLPIQPEMILDALPNRDSSPIEKIALENLMDGILAEKQRVQEFVREIDNAGTDYDAYLDVLRKFDGVRFCNKSRDGFIDTFQMIFQTNNDLSLAINVVDCLRNDSELRKATREKIMFWRNQWENLQPFPMNAKIRLALILARFDAWLDVIDRCEPHDAHDEIIDAEIIDAEFVDVREEHHDNVAADHLGLEATQEESKSEAEPQPEVRNAENPITADDWRKIADALKNEYRHISDFRQRIISKKFSRRRGRNSPLRKDNLLPGQITIAFGK